MGARGILTITSIPPSIYKVIHTPLASTRALMRQKEGEKMALTYVERRLIQAHREGAKIHVNYHENKDLDEAIQRMQRFGKITDYKDMDTSKRFYISSDAFEKLGVTATAFLDK